ncbi:MAG: cheY [Solirubrobacterales bacterium]|nr:cheY [Solirubrobacterales bacterium]
MPRIYLCDDQRDYRMLLKAVLTKAEGLDVVGEGGDGGFCIEDAAKTEPDVILLDVNMPGMDGIDALPHLREAMPGTKIIMLTTAPPEQCEERALARGASGFIQKPQNIFDLPGMIREKLAAAGIEL